MRTEAVSRRKLFKGGAGLAGASMIQVAFPSASLAQSGEDVLPWDDQPPPDEVDNVQPWERLDTWITPGERFFNVNHYGQPTSLDESTWRLEIAGLVARPLSLSVSDIRARHRQEEDFTVECSGDNGFPNFSFARPSLSNGHERSHISLVEHPSIRPVLRVPECPRRRGPADVS